MIFVRFSVRSIVVQCHIAQSVKFVVQCRQYGSALMGDGIVCRHFFIFRTALVSVVNFGSRLAFPLVLIGLLLDAFVISADPEMGFHIAMIGVILYGTSFLFTLVTLPVEINASRRAGKMLLQEGILTTDEMPGAKKVLSAAALTYLASLMTSLVYFLRFFLYVLTLFGRRNDRM